MPCTGDDDREWKGQQAPGPSAVREIGC
jgi:hypothetical protein